MQINLVMPSGAVKRDYFTSPLSAVEHIPSIPQMRFPPAVELLPVRVAHFNDALVSKTFLPIDGEDLWEYGFSHFWLRHHNANVVYEEFTPHPWTIDIGQVREIEAGILVSGGRHSADNYWHWLVDYLPRLSLVEDIPGPIILNDDLSSFQKESLEYFGVDREIIFKSPGETLRVGRLTAPTFLSQTGVVYPEAAKFLRSRLGHGAGPEKVYISRLDNPNRAIENEAEIEDYLSGKGFEIVRPHEHTFAGQVELFRNARVIVGPHGAGLTNAIFAPSGALVVEIVTKPRTAHASAASVCNQRYRHIMADTDIIAGLECVLN